MCEMERTIDLTYAKNALFVRQSVALAFGIPIDRELTWDFIQDRICNSHGFEMPGRVLIRGLPSPSSALGDESRMLRNLLRLLETAHGVEVRIVLHG